MGASDAAKLAFAMSTHRRLGAESNAGAVLDADSVQAICSFVDGFFDPRAVTIYSRGYSEVDEGDFDDHTIHVLLHEREEFLSVHSMSSSNIGGAWGKRHEVLLMDGDKLVIQEIHVGGTVSTGLTERAGEKVTYDLSHEWANHLAKKAPTTGEHHNCVT